MSPILSSTNPLLITDVPKLLTTTFQFQNSELSKKTSIQRLNYNGRKLSTKRGISAVSCLKHLKESNPIDDGDKCLERDRLPVLRRWEVPWDWKTTAYVMMPYLMSIAFTVFMDYTGYSGSSLAFSKSMLSKQHNTDEFAMRMFLDQFLKSIVKLSLLYFFISQYEPLPDDIFSIRWKQPFETQTGFLIWAGGGLLIASSVVFILCYLMPDSSVSQSPNEAESLVQLLPLIGSSTISTVSLLGIVGIFAPVCEEAIYRGFLLPSLTKWFPFPVAVTLSSATFTLAHHSSGKSLHIFIFGVLLGWVYAQTRNLLTPIVMHASWNVGVILFLTFLQIQGFDIQKFVL